MSYQPLEKPSSPNLEKIKALKAMFPEAFVDGKLNLEIFQEELEGIDDNLLGNIEETYGLTWTGKKQARRLAFIEPTGTLKFEENDSLRPEETKNLFLEGDNLEVLRILQKSYSGKIKLIYIDPPYNTGSDFVYKDDFKDTVESYLQKSGQTDDTGLLTSNPKTSGRYHANWLNMIYPRLKLARNLLKEDGVIFVSIDDNEQANLKKIMDEIFGEENFVTTIVWQKNYSPRNDAIYFSNMHEYILVYAKMKKTSKNDERGWTRNLMPRSEKQLSTYKNRDNDYRGPWKADNLTVKSYSSKYDYPIETPSGRIVNPPVNSCWRVSKEKFQELVEDNRIWFGETGNNVPALKRFLSEVQDGSVPVTWWKREDSGDSQEATKELRQLFADTGVPFETPKPVRLIKRILQTATLPNENDIVLDFFAGSGTTAQAVLEMNQEDGGNRQFILVQVPEPTNDSHFATIADVTKERIRRVINKVKENNDSQLTLGFKVYKLKKSNIRKWESFKSDSIDMLNNQIDLFANTPFTQDSDSIDIITELMLHQGFTLSSNIEEQDIRANKFWIINDENVPYSLVVCLDDRLDEENVEYFLSKHKSATFICLDNALSNEQKVLLSESMNVKTI